MSLPAAIPIGFRFRGITYPGIARERGRYRLHAPDGFQSEGVPLC